ncbi:condensation domain-containing protein [Granulicella sp. S190]|uniref:condensation domain-containing protein n=1 Tax=Granulicella sp. S190 TaxID=1747226 RepID=UPI00131A8A31|nr:condensation domain-containing protein [Granulicella sp. S190]
MKQEFHSATDSIANAPEEVPAVSTTASPADEVYFMPATQGQIRFWSLDQMHPGNPALNMPLMWQCLGELNVDLLALAFSMAVRRHEMLRTTFSMVDGKLSQIIGTPYSVALPVVDLQHLPDAANSQEAGRLIREHAAYRMDLFRGPLLTLKLLKFAPKHHLLLVTMHHIICDGISLGILLRDIAVFYEALVEEKEPVLPEMPIQFADFAVWQEEWRKSEAAEESLNFWRKTLGTNFGRIELPHDATLESRGDIRTDSESGDIETFLISPELTALAHEFCRNQNVTLNILLFSIFCALLHRVTGQRDIVIGSPCANRNEDTEELIGLFMNIQVLRVGIEPKETFRSLLTKVQDWTLGAYENQELPFEELIYDPHFSFNDASFEIPIFFLYQKSFMVTQQVAGLEITPLRSMSPGAVFEWMFAIVDRPEEGPRLQLEYNPNYFRPTTIQRYLTSFIALLESAVRESSIEVERMAPADDFLPATLPEYVNRPAARRSIRAFDEKQTGEDGEILEKLEEQVATVSDPIEIQLRELWRSMLGIEDISVDTNVFSLGVSSLSILRLVTRMNNLYSMGFGLASLISAPTIKMVAELVRRRYAPNTVTSLVPIQPVGTKRPLYIIHGAGGNVVNFYGLTTKIGADQPVYGVQAQALEAGKPALLRLEDMATHYLKEIRRVQPSGPYHLLGYSFGGVMALEMGRQLLEAGEKIGMLGMLDTRVRDYMEVPSSGTSTNHGKKQGGVGGFFRSHTGHGSAKAWFDFVQADFHERRIRYTVTLAARVSSTLPAFLKNTHEINAVAARKYKIKPFPGKLTLFRAEHQADSSIPSDNGWSAVFQGGVEVHTVPGDHWHVLSVPDIDVLAKSIYDCLSQFEEPVNR